MDSGSAASDGQQPQAVDCERFRLLRFLDDLEAQGELDRVSGQTALRGVAAKLDSTPKAVLFESAGPDGNRLAGNVVSSRARLARAFGTDPKGLLREVRRRLGTAPEIVEIASDRAPLHEVVLTEDADVTRLPANLQHGLDGREDPVGYSNYVV